MNGVSQTFLVSGESWKLFWSFFIRIETVRKPIALKSAKGLVEQVVGRGRPVIKNAAVACADKSPGICCRCAVNTSAERASEQSQNVALRIPLTLWLPTRTALSLSAWMQSRAVATATPAAISIPLCTSKPKSRPHSRGLARYATQS